MAKLAQGRRIYYLMRMRVARLVGESLALIGGYS
jgi:hypothetical protein